MYLRLWFILRNKYTAIDVGDVRFFLCFYVSFFRGLPGTDRTHLKYFFFSCNPRERVLSSYSSLFTLRVLVFSLIIHFFFWSTAPLPCSLSTCIASTISSLYLLSTRPNRLYSLSFLSATAVTRVFHLLRSICEHRWQIKSAKLKNKTSGWRDANAITGCVAVGVLCLYYSNVRFTRMQRRI